MVAERSGCWLWRRKRKPAIKLYSAKYTRTRVGVKLGRLQKVWGGRCPSPSMVSWRPARRFHGGSWGQGTWDRSVLLLTTACQSTISSIKTGVKKVTFLCPGKVKGTPATASPGPGPGPGSFLSCELSFLPHSASPVFLPECSCPLPDSHKQEFRTIPQDSGTDGGQGQGRPLSSGSGCTGLGHPTALGGTHSSLNPSEPLTALRPCLRLQGAAKGAECHSCGSWTSRPLALHVTLPHHVTLDNPCPLLPSFLPSFLP